MSASLLTNPTGPLVVPALSATPSMSGIRLSLVVPTYNESKNISSLVAQLEPLFEPILGEAFEIIIVDDDSPDRTWELALKLAEKHPCVRVLRRQGERGLSTAVIRGWQVARGEILAVMDGDLQHPTEVNLALLQEISRGADLAAASRHVEGGGVSNWAIGRRILSRGAQLLGLLLLPAVLGRLSDPMSGYFMIRRATLAGIELDPLGYKILIEVVARTNPKWIGEVGYTFRERVEGESKVTWKLYTQYFAHLLKLRWATLPNSRFFKFCVVGASGVLVDMAILFLLSDPGALGWGLTRSKMIAAETAILTNFLLNDYWTFGDVVRLTPGTESRVRRFLGFNAICFVGLMLNLALLNLLFNFAHLNRYLANGLSILAVTGWNYWLNRKLNWAPVTVGNSRMELNARKHSAIAVPPPTAPPEAAGLPHGLPPAASTSSPIWPPVSGS